MQKRRKWEKCKKNMYVEREKGTVTQFSKDGSLFGVTKNYCKLYYTCICCKNIYFCWVIAIDFSQRKLEKAFSPTFSWKENVKGDNVNSNPPSDVCQCLLQNCWNDQQNRNIVYSMFRLKGKRIGLTGYKFFAGNKWLESCIKCI